LWSQDEEKVEAPTMIWSRNVALVLVCSAAVGFDLGNLPGTPLATAQQTQAPASANSARPVGTVKAVAGNTVTLTTDSGGEIAIVVQDSTRILHAAPGQKDLKDATPVALPEVQVGDRLLVRGRASEDKSVIASSIVLMKKADIEQRQAHEREDWQKRGVGGLVTKVDAAGGIIAVSTAASAENKAVAVRIAKDTIIRRYAPESVKFDDAKLGTLEQIQPGDQLRARGTRSADGAELAAEEIVSGSFRNISGTIASIDLPNNTLNVVDLATKKPVVVKITAESQLRKLPQQIAERIALRLRGTTPQGAPGAASAGAGRPAARPGAMPANGEGGGPHAVGAPDFHQMLNRIPTVSLAELQKGEAVMIVTTQGSTGSEVKAITFLSGVEPILRSPNSSQAAMLLSPWNLGGGGGGDAE
jgi:hypothetical protein